MAGAKRGGGREKSTKEGKGKGSPAIRGHLEKRETGIRNRNGNRNRNRNRNWNRRRNRNEKKNLYKNRDNIYLN